MEFLDFSLRAREAEQRTAEEHRKREIEQAHALARAEQARAEEQRKSAKKYRRMYLLSAVVAVIAVLSSLGAWYMKREAESHKHQAIAEQTKAERAERRAEKQLSRFLTANANKMMKTQPRTALLLAAEAADRFPKGLSTLRQLLVQTGGQAIAALGKDVVLMASSSDGKMLATASSDGKVFLHRDIAYLADGTELPTGKPGRPQALAFAGDDLIAVTRHPLPDRGRSHGPSAPALRSFAPPAERRRWPREPLRHWLVRASD